MWYFTSDIEFLLHIVDKTKKVSPIFKGGSSHWIRAWLKYTFHRQILEIIALDSSLQYAVTQHHMVLLYKVQECWSKKKDYLFLKLLDVFPG